MLTLTLRRYTFLVSSMSTRFHTQLTTGDTMTRKDFELIAKAIKTLDDVTPEQKRSIAYDFALVLEQTNPRFDGVRFVTACIGSV